MHDTADLIDIGPAPAPPNWWVPGQGGQRGAEHAAPPAPTWLRGIDPDYLVDDDGPVTVWDREFAGGDVWITVYDRIVGGRVMRSKPVVFVSDAVAAPAGGLTVERARELAGALLDAIETAEGDTERHEFLVCRRDGERMVVCSRHADGVAGWGALDRERAALRRAGIDTSGDDAPWLERVAPGGQPGEGVRL
ncbi:hypothetical protein MSM1_17505 [Mycobacterium sp. SM1]|uniref:hypothetical protein n=1 Tax=Mycobacterium sp. SM1 TaxID=2816243 RepID=UPI001BD0F2B2|nr:hypothetical protein [Mycobacterium sp. SM1]MBS4730056.1 hypothetical protein [Mycobacterium sp. SM1]